jgi:hypothetical protein
LYKTRESEGFRKSAGFLRDNVAILAGHPMKDRYTRVTAPAGFDDQATRRDYYFKTRNAAREFRLRIDSQALEGTRHKSKTSDSI